MRGLCTDADKGFMYGRFCETTPGFKYTLLEEYTFDDTTVDLENPDLSTRNLGNSGTTVYTSY